jgi:hypothetical protein
MKQGIQAREVSSYSSPFGFSPSRPLNPEPVDPDQPVIEEEENDEPEEMKAPVKSSGFFGNDPFNTPVAEDEEAEEGEEPTNEEEEEEEEPVESGSFAENEDDSDIDQSSLIPTLLSTFKSLGVIDEEFKAPESGKVADFFLEIDKNRAKQIDAIVREEYEKTYSKDVLQYVDFITKGGDPQAISDHYAIMNLPIEDADRDSENRKALILAWYTDKGIPEKKARALYAQSFEDGEDMQDAIEAKNYFNDKHQVALSELQEQQKQIMAERERQQREATENLRNTLRSGKIADIELTKKEVSELENYMFDQSVIVNVPDPNTGKSYKAKVSQYYLDYNNFFNSPESLIKLARFIKSNGNVDIVRSKMREELSNDLLMELSGVAKQKRGKTGKTNAFFNS